MDTISHLSEASNPTVGSIKVLNVYLYSKVHTCCCSGLVLASLYDIAHQ